MTAAVATRDSKKKALSPDELARGPRRQLTAGAGLILLGLAMVGIDDSDAGSAIALVGLLVLIWGIHSFGRLGPDEP